MSLDGFVVCFGVGHVYGEVGMWSMGFVGDEVR